MKKTFYLVLAIIMLSSTVKIHAQMWMPVAGGNLVTDPTTNNVGIGVMAPTDPLTVNTTISLYEPNDKYRYILGRSLLTGLKVCANIDETEASMTLHATNEGSYAAGSVQFMSVNGPNSNYAYTFGNMNSGSFSNFFTINNTGFASFSNDLSVNGSTFLSGSNYLYNLSVNGSATLNSGLNVASGNLIVNTGQLRVAGNTTLQSDLSVQGLLSLNGNFTTNGSINAGGSGVGVLSTLNGGIDIPNGPLNVDYGSIGCSDNISCHGVMNANSGLVSGAYSTFTGGAHLPSGTFDIDAFAGTGNRMIKASSAGQLGYENMPSLSVSGTTLTLSNGGSISSSIALPSGSSSWVGTATSPLNMAGHQIVGVPTITGSSLTITGLTSLVGTNSSGVAINGASTILGTGGSSLVMSVTGTVTTPGTFVVKGGPSTSGDFVVNGTTFCTSGTWAGSDKRYKKDIKDLENIAENLFKTLPKSYNFKVDEFRDRNFDGRNHYGFIAQEVKDIFPNLVKLDSDGYYAINYIEFIPLLVQTLKEEDTKLKDYENRLSNLENEMQELKYNSINTGTSSVSTTGNNKTTLSQNVPNPFNAQTVINFNIVGSFKQAFIGIYDLTGKEIKKIAVKMEMNSVTISSGTLRPGMYIYSLVVDDLLVDSKKMVATN